MVEVRTFRIKRGDVVIQLNCAAAVVEDRLEDMNIQRKELNVIHSSLSSASFTNSSYLERQDSVKLINCCY